MTNIKINSTANGTFTVTADTERHGINAIMFEGLTRAECAAYIRRESVKVLTYADNKSHDALDAAYDAIMRHLPIEKKAQIVKAMDRNAYFTSAWTLEHTDITCYPEGVYIMLKGCQSAVNIWIDKNGNVTRKPSYKTLSESINNRYFHNWEGDFQYMIRDIETAEEEEAIDNAAEDIRTAIECGMIEASPATTTAPTDAAEEPATTATTTAAPLQLETLSARLDRMTAAELVDLYAATSAPGSVDDETDSAIYDALRASNPRAYRVWMKTSVEYNPGDPDSIAAANAADVERLRAAYGITA